MIETSVAALIKAVKLATSTLEPSSPVACSNPIEPVFSGIGIKPTGTYRSAHFHLRCLICIVALLTTCILTSILACHM